MELWFWAVVGATILGGIGNFILKIAAVRGYGGGLFTFYGSLMPTLLIFGVALYMSNNILFSLIGFSLSFLNGLLGASSNILKVLALRYIDTTIYFPLFKILAPLLVTVAGLFVFNESLSVKETIGLLICICIPLFFVGKAERKRQLDLKRGLLLILATAIISVVGASLTKYVIVVWAEPLWLLVATGAGSIIGSVCGIVFKEKRDVFTRHYWLKSDKGLIVWSTAWGLLMVFSALLIFVAYLNSGGLIIVYAINSLNFVIPIILAVIIYKEHIDIQKASAIFLSIVALGLLG